MATRSELRSFAGNLLLVGDGLFFGSLFFTFCFRRSAATEWRSAWDHIPGAPLRLGLVLVLFAGAWGAYGKGLRAPLSALLGGLAAALLVSLIPAADALRLDAGSRSAVISLLACLALFALHASGLAAGGVVAKGEPVFRRFLLFQFLTALLILPVVFTW